MTLLIAFMLLGQMNAGTGSYVMVTVLWVLHLGYHSGK